MKLGSVTKVAVAAAACWMPFCARAMVLTTPVHITTIHGYTEFGNGDVVFNVDASFQGCFGYWLAPADPGFKQVYAMLLMVKAANAPVVVYADETVLWPGSGSAYCRVRTLTPQ